MKLNSSNPARSTATGTQKWTSVSTRSSRLEFAFGLSVDARRVTALTIKRDVEFFAIANRLQAGFLSRRFRHRRNFDLRIGEWYAAAKLERIETRGTPLRFGRGHGARGREQARAGAPTHRSNDVLLTLRRKSHGNRVDRGLRLDGPEFFPGVGGIGGKFAGSLPLKNQVPGGRQYAAIHGDGFFGRPARGLGNRI